MRNPVIVAVLRAGSAAALALALATATPLAAAPRAAASGSAETRGVLTELTHCKDIADDTARLACYDAAVAKLAAATASGDVKVLDREEIRETRRGLFGFDLPKLPFFKGDDSAKDTPEELDTVIRSVGSESYGKFVLTMADGAVWRASEPLPRDPKAGMKVHLKRGAIGNYFMSVGAMHAVRAQRVK